MSKIVIVKTCKECNALFNITEGEANFLTSHGLAMFERCADCRKLRRAQREALAEAIVKEEPQEQE